MNETPIPGPPGIVFAQRCDRGKVREDNQDSVLHARIPLGELLIVADGMGGYKGGAAASRMAIESFHKYLAGLPQNYPPDRAIQEASERANADIFAAASAPDSTFRRMGSTVVLALLQQNAIGANDRKSAWIGHIGDSRAYLARDGRLTRITRDHSAVQQLLDSNLITPEQARHHPDVSVLTRSLGHQLEVEIEIDNVPLAAGDTLLLCSDGLWGYVPESELQNAAANTNLTLETAAQALLDLALASGGPDNIGIEMVRLIAYSAAEPPTLTPPAVRKFNEAVAVTLLAFAVVGVIFFFALLQHISNIYHPRH
jgi:protein phosphatase